MVALVVNAGSQTVKLRIVDDREHILAAVDLGPPDDDLPAQVADFLRSFGGRIDVAGHRVVHGGPDYAGAVVVDAAVRAKLETLNELAPLHNPSAVAAIDATRALLPEVPSVACFDTAFHATLTPASTAYAVPSEWVTRWGIRRYGFHGLSCAWATRRGAEMSGRPAAQLRLLICHLGAGASVTAVTAGRSVDTTMGFTPLEGLVMATRSGDLDPGALLWVLQRGLAVTDAHAALEQQSGLLGLSGGRSNDMRELLTARDDHDELATLAVSVYLHRLVAKIAAMAAASRGVDALIFTGGVGEHSAVIRAETVAGLTWLGIGIDPNANDCVGDADTDISPAGAAIRTLVVHAREDLQIAAECRHLLGAS
jgi:acetate kinase